MKKSTASYPDTDPVSLTLFDVSLPLDDDLGAQLHALELDKCTVLRPFNRELSSIFKDPQKEHLHLLVKRPTPCEFPRSSSVVTEF